MKITEVQMSVLAVPQGYSIAQAISRDLNFKVGLPAQFEKAFNVKEKLEALFTNIEIGTTYMCDNLYSLVVKDSSYDAPDRDSLMDAIMSLRDYMELNHDTNLAMPKLCCGKMGLDWEDVKSMFEMVFDDTDVNILVCCQ